MKFLTENEIPEINLTFINFFFTSMGDKHSRFTNDELFHMESIIKLLTKLSCKGKE